MSSTSDDNRFAPPLAHVEDVAQGPGVLAGRWIRLGATLIDAVVAGLAFGLLALVSPINVFRPSLASSNGLWMLLVQNLVLGFILFLVIHGYLIATRGQTIGKALLKIRIVRSDGTPASFARIVGLRYLTTSVLASIPVVGTIYGLVDVLLIFRASRRCLHDNIADTIVVTA
ncbi:MAG: RDD family protein [Pseudomonadota bacterium]|nr:RDD family protein [Pseudomonadota bacterium]